MQVRAATDGPRPRYHVLRRAFGQLLRWSFIAVGAMTTAAVLFVHLYRVNETIYDPSLFAVGVSGLFAMACGVMLVLMSRIRAQKLALRHAQARCEELADGTFGLREAEARATSLLEAQGDFIVRRDAQGRITYANDAFCALAGLPRETLIGSAATLAVTEQGAPTVQTDGTRIHDQKIVTAEGPRWLAWRDVVVFLAGGAEVQSVGRDVTDRTETGRALAAARDAAEAASGAKSRFLAMVSHEIRTPLNGIIGMTDLLLDTPLTLEQTSYVHAAKQSGDALLSLIEDILDFSKIEAGKLDLATHPFSLAALVEETVELLGPRAQAKGLEIASDIDERLPAQVVGDATRLRQVLLNLAGNAIKFTETGGVGVTVAPAPEPGHVVIAVRDTGIGIAPEEQARIFREFEQVEDGAARKFGGTGLGLTISQRIVDRMGGRIAVASAPGGGATFTITVALPPPAGDTTPPAPTPDLNGRAILIAAPDAPHAALLAGRLMRWGALVTRADGARAADHLASGCFDTLLVDLALGAGAAITLMRRADAAVTQRLVLTTPGERHRLPALKAAGFTGYLVKPLRAASLAAQLHAPGTFDTGGAEPPARSAAPAAEGRVARSVLLAEDNEINALLACAMLGKLGHRVTVATDGNGARDAFDAARIAGAPYDIVLMDVQMPGLDGLAATQAIREIEARHGTARTPVIALTANAFAEDRAACRDAGMDGFLVKPLDRDRLAAVLDAHAPRASQAA